MHHAGGACSSGLAILAWDVGQCGGGASWGGMRPAPSSLCLVPAGHHPHQTLVQSASSPSKKHALRHGALTLAFLSCMQAGGAAKEAAGQMAQEVKEAAAEVREGLRVALLCSALCMALKLGLRG